MPMTDETYAKYPLIRITYDKSADPSFAMTIKEMLDTIDSKPVGRALLTALSPAELPRAASHGFTCRIIRAKAIFGAARSVDLTSGAQDPSHNTSNKAVRVSEVDACNGNGSASTVHFNTNMYRTPNGPRPPFVALAHEMIHALHNLNGDADKDVTTEENRTVGIGSNHNIYQEAITENKVRLEHDLPLRMVY